MPTGKLVHPNEGQSVIVFYDEKSLQTGDDRIELTVLVERNQHPQGKDVYVVNQYDRFIAEEVAFDVEVLTTPPASCLLPQGTPIKIAISNRELIHSDGAEFQ